MFLAEQLPALAAVDSAVEGAEGLLAHGVETDVIEGSPLPVGTSYGEIRVSVLGAGAPVLDRGEGRGRGGRGRGVVGLEDVEALEFLVQHGDGLEGFGLQHAFAEPGADVVLFDFVDFSVEVVEVAIQMSVLPVYRISTPYMMVVMSMISPISYTPPNIPPLISCHIPPTPYNI